MPRPTTHFVDWQALEQRLTAPPTSHRSVQRSTRPRILTTVDEETASLRANVRDSAAAVVQWLASVMDHDGSAGPDEVVDRCLRPGPDASRLNYAALADEINREMNTDLTAKRLKTAIAHLRHRRARKGTKTTSPPTAQGLDGLRKSLESHHAVLTRRESNGHAAIRRRIGLEVLAAVRRAAGRLIENDYGEGIPEQIDLDDLEGAFLEFMRSRRRAAEHGHEAAAKTGDLHRLLVTVCEFEATVSGDMRLVLDGSRVVTALFGPATLPGILAELNVLVAGRALMESGHYVTEMLRLARKASHLHHDPDTRRLLQWVRRRDGVAGLPSPLRLRSYCLNNACTHVLERVFRDELPETSAGMAHATIWFRQMVRRDAGFELARTTRVLLLTVAAHQSGDAEPIQSHFRRLGRQRVLEVLKDLYRYESCESLCRAAESHAVAAIPELEHQLLHAG